MINDVDAYNELCAYTLSHGDAEFIHQHVVDAYAAQHADDDSKPIGIAFALIGLYLCVEKQWTGRQVQRAHLLLGRRRRGWPRFALPPARGLMSAREVIGAAEGPERDEAIHAWCRSVWAAFVDSREAVIALLAEYHIQ